jgi:hypothetical protein
MTMAAKKKRRQVGTKKRKSTKRKKAPKKRKTAARSNRIPLKILEKRLRKLNMIVKSRGGSV